MEWSQGDLVWFDPGLGHPLPGEIQEVHRAAQVIIVQALINGQTQTFTLSPGEGNLRLRQDLGISGVDDMTQLDDLHEASLLWNLRLRYDRGLIYTFAGSILIAVNPYKMFPDSYGIDIAKKYAGKPLGDLPPHLFAVGAAAHASLPSPQVVVISGESGSGKTESTKLVMQYLAAVVPGGGSASAVITEQILEAAPLLEAFGNARTARNDNSSRFGKYLEVYFKQGAIVGAKITQYLLEKSRIVTQAPGERNYHVFYELLGGLSEADRSKYGLLEADKYFYLNQGGSDCVPGRVDWVSLQGAMQVLGVSETEQDGIVRVLASVLHLGNVYFHRRQLRHGQEGVEVGSDAEIKWAAHLLHIPTEGLHLSLTTRVTETRSERLHTPLGIDQALDARDAFAKVLYSGLFNWLVSRINSIVHKGGTHDAHRISILDIFGFEDLVENSFEQLCINYANENLQLYFNKHVFKLEQAEYARERLEWTSLAWEDNLPVIHLLAKKPVGIFHLLDDESNFPRASDLSFLEKCHYNHALNEIYSRPRIGAQEFGVTHYAGQVWYCVEGFLEKNRDALRPDVLELLGSSKLPLVCDMTRQLRAQRDIGKTMPKGANGRFVTMKPRTPTVAARFSDSLQHLLQSMAKCNPWFVRCIKPNNDKHALRMDMPCVLQQLRYLGMLDTIRIRQKGYPVRLRFQHFVERYRHMIRNPLPRGTPYRELCRNVLDTLPHTGIEGPDFQLGATRVFLRETQHRALEKKRSERLRRAAVIIQRNVRGMMTRKKLQRRHRAAVSIQSIWKGHQQQKRYRNLRAGAVRLQSLYRGRRQRQVYNKLKAEMKRRRAVDQAQRERLQQKLIKEQERTLASAHLDVPAELAFIFSKLDGWSPVHGDTHLVKVVGTVPGPPISEDLPNDLDQFSFRKFSSVYCNGVQLVPRRDPITTPFLSRTSSRDQDLQDSLAVFKLILRWTGDTNLNSAKEKALGDYIVYKGLSSRGLRDEILVQLCNQVYRTDDTQGNKIWQLMAHCLSSFPPGPAFHKYLMKFISDNAPSSIKEILLKKLLRNGMGSQSAGPSRQFPPSWLEWRSTSRHSDIAIGLTLPDDVTQTVAIDSWTTCEEAASLAISSLGIPNQGWTITLDDSGLVTDSCGLDYVMDLVSEMEVCPAFPSIRIDLLRSGRHNLRSNVSIVEQELTGIKRPQVPPPDPPATMTQNLLKHSQQKRHTEAMVETNHRSNENSLDVSDRNRITDKPIQNMDIADNEYSSGRQFEMVTRKTSHDLLSRSSALNDRYFETDKLRSRSLDDLLTGDAENEPIQSSNPEPEPLLNLGLSESRLNDRYHSSERLAPIVAKESTPRYQKSQFAGRRSVGAHSSKYAERSEYATRSSAMSDTSEAPSLASHVRRVRVPSQASDVDQFLDELFSPVLDGSLDELSDARSLAASIRGSHIVDDMMDALMIDNDINDLTSVRHLACAIKGGGQEVARPNTSTAALDREVEAITNPSSEISLDEYITDLFQPIFVNDSIRRLTEKTELAEAIKGGGTVHHHSGTSHGFVTSQRVISPKSSLSPSQMQLMNSMSPENFSTSSNPESPNYQQNMQRAFLQSAMVQNLQIQQQLLAQNQALQTLLSQSGQETTTTTTANAAVSSPIDVVHQPITLHQTESSKPPPIRKQSFKSRISSSPFSDGDRFRKASSESIGSHIPPPPPPPMPPPIEFKDPSEARPFLDPYGRAKTVRIGKWRWPPPQDAVGMNELDENFMHFKMRQHQRKNTPQSQSSSPVATAVEWDEFEIEPTLTVAIKNSNHHHHQLIAATSSANAQEKAIHHMHNNNLHRKFSQPEPVAHQAAKSSRRSFEIGAERPPPGSVGKLKLSSEMRQRLEQVTAGHSVRSSTSNKSDQRAPAKLEDARKMMLQQQLSGNLLSQHHSDEVGDLPSVRTQIQRMEAGKRPKPPPWPTVLPPAPSGPAPPPPIRPPTDVPPMPPPPIPIAYQQTQLHSQGSAHAQQQHQAPVVDLPAFVQRQERDTFGIHQNWNGSETSKDVFDSWERAETSNNHHHNMVYEESYKKEINIQPAAVRSRSRSRSRDREHFSESVWDRTEVEGPPSSGSGDRELHKERGKRERIYEIKQLERERESSKVYQPMQPNKPKEKINAHVKTAPYPTKATGQTTHERATFKTHMTNRMERERKHSSSTLASQNQNAHFEDIYTDDWPTPVIPAVPIPIPPPSLKSPAAACLTYNRVPWKLRVRKEVFRPSESIGIPACVDLLFAQIVADVFETTACIRITSVERRAAQAFLASNDITTDSIAKIQVRAIIKRHLIDMARSWPLYFARFFLVSGSPQIPDVSILAISHSGVYFARRDAEHITVIRTVLFDDLNGAVTLPRPAALQLNFRNGNRTILHASRASAIQHMIQSYCHEQRHIQSKTSTISSGARAAAHTLNVPIEHLEAKSQDNATNTSAPITKPYSENVHKQTNSTNSKSEAITYHENGSMPTSPSPGDVSLTAVYRNHESNVYPHHSAATKRSSMNDEMTMNTNTEHQHIVELPSAMNTSPPVVKYSLLQFAMQHFRNDQAIDDQKKAERNEKPTTRTSTTARPHTDLVKWQGSSILAPLLRLPQDISALALECFDCILRYCGDIPLTLEITEVKCVYTVLMHCHKHLTLRDEVYCQLMKQTTANRSQCPDSSQRAWRLLSVLAAYFGCSEALKPYLLEHLSSTASDRNRSSHGTAAVCLTNLRKTARCGGRKNVPSVEEVTAVSAGRSARRQIYRLPGGAERVVNTRCSTVVADVIAELCALLGIDSVTEQQEFSLYCIVQGDAFTMPLAADEYILDVTTELLKSGQPFYLIFCRSVWHYQLRREPAPTPLYIEVLFNQVAPDYLEGLLLELPNGGAPDPDVVRDMARVAALLHRAADLNHVPAMKEIKFLLPKPALGIRELRPAQWVALVQSAWPSIASLSPGQVKAQFLSLLATWTLFGSSFFAVKRVWAEDAPPPAVDEPASMWRDLILALNRRGVLFLDPNTHETLQHWPFMEVISTRKVRSEDGALYLDMKVGNLMQQRVIRVQTEQAHEISRLVRQYITMAQFGNQQYRRE